jgi:hypothetical protein
MTYQVQLTMKSNNRKVGAIPVSTTSADTCPDSCPFKKNGCYADGGPLAMHWAKVTKRQRGDTFQVFLGKISALPDGQLWRHNQAGDLPGHNGKLDADACVDLCLANAGKRGWTYTHYDVLDNDYNANVVKHMVMNGFVVNLSGNSLAHADKLADLGIAPVTTVLPSDQMTNTVTPAGRKVVVCPAVTRDDVSCADCQLCARLRDVIVGFPAHGNAKRKADAVAAA